MSDKRFSIDISRQGGDLSRVILHEIQSILALLRRQISVFSCETGLRTNLICFSMAFRCPARSVNLQCDPPVLSENILSKMKSFRSSQRMQMGIQGILHEGTCSWAPVMCRETLFYDLQATPHQVVFKNIDWAEALSPDWSPISSPLVQNRALVQDKPILKTISPSMNLIRAWKFPKKLFCLPIRKETIPVHRFSAAQRMQFKQALAAKAGIAVGNVIIKKIYARMNMRLYQTIVQDEHDGLLCTPREESMGIGKNENYLPNKAIGQTGYLIFGLRLDTRDSIHAFVSADIPERG